jgi:2-oxoglutarate ferredoxin oxidoreductase subunit beta
MSDDFSTAAEITWCPGCGNFGILNALKKAIVKLEEQGLKRSNIMISSGIGCHGKIFDYIPLSGLYSIHGRSIATVQGIKLGNPDLKVVAFVGDGDAYGEGIAHMIFAAKRNADITVVVHNNGAYALTTGQFSPTSKKGYKGPSIPEGNVEEPLNPLSLLLEAGASFVARGYAGKINHLSDIIVEAILHDGFSIVDVLQPSVVFSNNYKFYNEITEIIPKSARSFNEAIKLVKEMEDRIPIGVFYKIKKTIFHKELYGNWNPIRDKLDKEDRLKRVEQLLKQELNTFDN